MSCAHAAQHTHTCSNDTDDAKNDDDASDAVMSLCSNGGDSDGGADERHDTARRMTTISDSSSSNVTNSGGNDGDDENNNNNGSSSDSDDDDDEVRAALLPWRVCDAFHLGMLCVLHYVGAALPPRELLTMRLILQLCCVTTAAAANNTKRDSDNDNDDDSRSSSVSLDAAELLLRLALRKPCAFALAGVVAHYGGRLRVHDALARLANTRVDGGVDTRPRTVATRTAASVSSDNNSDDGDERQRPQQERDGNNCAVRRWCGAVVADALLRLTCVAPHVMHSGGHNNDGGDDDDGDVGGDDGDGDGAENACGSPTCTPAARRGYALLASVLAAVRASELRPFAVALYQHYALHCTAAAATTTATAATATADADVVTSLTAPPVPTRKGDVMRYILLRRYHATAVRGCACDVAVERALLARCWDRLVGDVYTVHAAVKRHVVALAALMHALTDTLDEFWPTGNGGGGAPMLLFGERHYGRLCGMAPSSPSSLPSSPSWSSRGSNSKSDAATAAAEDTTTAAAAATTARTASTLLFTRGQFDVLRRLHGRALPPLPPQPQPQEEDDKNKPRDSEGDVADDDDGCRDVRAWLCDVCLADDAASLASWRAGLRVLHGLRGIAEAPRAVVRDAQQRIRRWYDTTLRAINALATTAAATRRPTSSQGRVTLWWVLRTHGLRAQHLLRYTPLYGWFACLEVLYELLQTLRCYREANVCLRLLLEEPVLQLRSSDVLDGDAAAGAVAPPRGGAVVSVALHYRVDKRGKWQHRLALNTAHLRERAAALRLLEDAHASWHAATQLRDDERDALQQLRARCRPCACALCAGGGRRRQDGMDDARGGGGVVALRALVSRLPAALQRRVRLLRALWPSVPRDGGDNDGDGRYACAVYHAVAEYTHARYCRRHDRVRIEAALRALHGQLRRWTPLARRLRAFSDGLAPAPALTVRGVRDAHARTLWHDAARRFAAASVEGFVLQQLLCNWAGDSGNGSSGAPPRRGCVVRRGAWRGVHCEGAWLAQLARALLSPRGGEDDDAGAWLWLTPLQSAPLDRHTPLDYVERRRAWLTRRLSALAAMSRAEVLALVARQDVGDGDDDGELPLRSMLGALSPNAALWSLLRRLLLSDPLDGYTPRFSGFPDLVLWRGGGGGGAAPSFVLVEVKSPTDELSSRQRVVNDALRACGFDVRLANVVEDAAPRSGKRTRTA